MQDTLLSPFWFRIAGLHPRLRPHVSVRMQTTRGQAWYVLFNQATGRHHRVNAQAYQLVGRLDGRHSVDDIWNTLIEQQADDAPSQHDVIRILGQMTDAGLIQAEVTPDVREMVRADEARTRKEKRARLNPLSFRLGLFNPSAMLEKLMPVARLLWSPWATALWLALVLGATWATLVDLRAVFSYGRTYFMSPGYLAVAWVVYPLMKALHEMGHALALRRYGCEVPEVGVNFFLFVPMPYVDASASHRLVNRWQRARISMAGIAVELALAAAAALVWLAVEDGWVRQVAFVVMTLGGVSTLLLNGNPLMKLDGYYVMCDVLDLPNLAQRSGRMLSYLARRAALAVLGVRHDEEPLGIVAADALERWALWLYSPASWLYRLAITAVAVAWAADKAAWLGLVVAAWSGWSLLARPLWAWLQSLLSQPGFVSARGRALVAGGFLAAAVLAALAWVPVPSSTVLQGVVWLPEDAQVRAGIDGEIEAVWVKAESPVVEGEALFSLRAPGLEAQRNVLLAQIERSMAEYNAAFGIDRLRMQNAQEALARDRTALARVEQDLEARVLRAATDGHFVLSREQDLDGQQVSRGQVLAYVLNNRPTIVRAVVPQRVIDDLRHRRGTVEVLLDEERGTRRPARWLREVPAATDRLPAPVLGERLGGRVPTDPTDPDGLRPLEPMFVIDVELDEALPRAGGLARVRVSLEPQSLLETASGHLRQLFLKHFSGVPV